MNVAPIFVGLLFLSVISIIFRIIGYRFTKKNGLTERDRDIDFIEYMVFSTMADDVNLFSLVRGFFHAVFGAAIVGCFVAIIGWIVGKILYFIF